MRILVTAASRHGATLEIAESIAASLGDEGLDATVRTPDAVPELAPYDAVIVGSAVYAGNRAAERRSCAADVKTDRTAQCASRTG